MDQIIDNAPRRGRPPKNEEFAVTHPHAFRETLAEFEARVAQLTAGDWIETTPEVIKEVFKRGLSGKKYGLYRNVVVCALGDYAQIEKDSKMEVDELLFPGISGTTT